MVYPGNVTELGTFRLFPGFGSAARLDSRKCNIITFQRSGTAMTHHSHPVGHRHHPVSVSPSILRLSAWQRLAAVAIVIGALWVAVHWAMS
jgi:hypothetical protein